MRSTALLLSATVLLSSGCFSVMIGRSGMDLRNVTTRELVHEQFGEPAAMGLSEGKSFEEFCTHRKIYDPSQVAGLGLALGMTWGAAEFIALPCALWDLAHTSILGQNIRFTYDRDGDVADVFLDGRQLDPFFRGRQLDPFFRSVPRPIPKREAALIEMGLVGGVALSAAQAALAAEPRPPDR
jgi:hypothetical protein